MQPRRVARELALLGASQLPSSPEKLGQKTYRDLIVAAVRSLSEEIQDTLNTASDEVRRGDRLLQEGALTLPLGEERKTNLSASTREAAGDRAELARLRQIHSQLQRLETGLRTADSSRTSTSTLLAELSGVAQQASTAIGSATQYFTTFERRLQTARQTMVEAVELTQTAINRLGSAVALPEFVRIADEPEVLDYATRLVATVAAERATIDERLQQALVGWQLERLGRVERDILRIAVVEIEILSTAPAKVAINEAVELAKKYGGEESASFVNGVLRRFSTLEQPL
jgi:N utilization substance protein B